MSALDIGTTISNQALQYYEIVQGTTAATRTGNEISLKSFDMQVQITAKSTMVLTGHRPTVNILFMLIPNADLATYPPTLFGAAFGVSKSVFLTSTQSLVLQRNNPPLNNTCLGTFKILKWDRIPLFKYCKGHGPAYANFVQTNVAIPGANTGTTAYEVDFSCIWRRYRFGFPRGLSVEYDANTGAYTDIQKNAIFIFEWVDGFNDGVNADCTIAYDCQSRYTDS